MAVEALLPPCASVLYVRRFLPPSPPAEKATARQDKAGQSGTERRGRKQRYTFQKKPIFSVESLDR
jgi:hypothetical protein